MSDLSDIIFVGSSGDTYIFGRDGRDEELEVVFRLNRWLDADTLEPISPALSAKLNSIMRGGEE